LFTGFRTGVLNGFDNPLCWREMRDEEIDYSDIPKLDKSFWKKSQAHHAGAKRTA
jgi:hypothetical protein